MNIKIKPLLYIFIVVLIAFTLIGFFISNTILPIQQNKHFENLQYSIVHAKEDVNEDTQEIRFTVNEEVPLYKAVQELNNVIENSEYSEYTLKLNTEQESDPLHAVWEQLQYNVYEIMGHKKFTELPTLPYEVSKKYPDINVSVSMDEQFVYITLENETDKLYRMLPIHTTNLGAWG